MTGRLGIGIAMCLPLLLASAAFAASAGDPARVPVYRDTTSPPAEFAAQEIGAALRRQGVGVADRPLSAWSDSAGEGPRVVLAVDPSAGLKPQGYALRVGPGGVYRVVGADAPGLMYGGLHLAEAIRLETGFSGIADAAGSPAILRRGLKFNIPLDARTPSYDDTGDAAQNNIAEMWNFDFWKEFLDDMARHRYNTLTLWNPHPFPSLLKLEKYPGVALEDVCVTTLQPDAKGGSWREPQGVSPEVLANLRVVKKMSVDEKVAFWRRVMRHARDRGIDVYVITWNVLVNGAEGKHGITAAQGNPRTIAYLRECTRELVLTYPDLAGIGVTAGERMSDRPDEFDREKWLWSTYGMGVVDARKEQPGRDVRFIHRVWNTDLVRIVRDFASQYPCTFEVGFKYSRARLYSSTRPPFADDLIKEMRQHKLKAWWNLRNDDIFCFRWGDPDYVREFLTNLPPDCTAGYHMGSDGYVWGREFTSLRPDEPRAMEIRKHWYSFMLWGRLGYDPRLDRGFFEKVLADRFPGARAAALYDAWAAASKIIPQVNRFHWRDWDFQWAVEGCMDQGKGFHTVDDFARGATMQSSGLVPIPQYVKATLAREALAGIAPTEVAANLKTRAAAALAGVASIRRDTPKPGKELDETLGDIQAMAHLGEYYSAKILGAVELETFRQSRDIKGREAAVRHLEEAVERWKAYGTVAAGLYKPQLLARTRALDWMKLLDEVKKDVDIARGSAK